MTSMTSMTRSRWPASPPAIDGRSATESPSRSRSKRPRCRSAERPSAKRMGGAQARRRVRLEPLGVDRLAAGLAASIGAGIDAGQGTVDARELTLDALERRQVDRRLVGPRRRLVGL